MICLRVPEEAARLLERVDVPGNPVPASDMHVTILYIGKDVSVVDLAKATVAAHAVTSRTPPFVVHLSAISSFPRNPDDGWPIICPIDSPELQALNAGLKEEFTRLGLAFSDKWPDYKPHVTLAYDPTEEEVSVSQALPVSVPFTALEVLMYGGSGLRQGVGSLYVGLPLNLTPVERVASRLCMI